MDNINIKKCSHCGNTIIKEQIKEKNVDRQGFLFCDFCLDCCHKLEY